jgi:hypothetical protein
MNFNNVNGIDQKDKTYTYGKILMAHMIQTTCVCVCVCVCVCTHTWKLLHDETTYMDQINFMIKDGKLIILTTYWKESHGNNSTTWMTKQWIHMTKFNICVATFIHLMYFINIIYMCFPYYCIFLKIHQYFPICCKVKARV